MFCDIAGRTENEIKKVKLKLEISPTTHDPYTHLGLSYHTTLKLIEFHATIPWTIIFVKKEGYLFIINKQ
jgi:hypothetical protein